MLEHTDTLDPTLHSFVLVLSDSAQVEKKVAKVEIARGMR